MLIVVKYEGFAAHEILQKESFNYHNLKNLFITEMCSN